MRAVLEVWLAGQRVARDRSELHGASEKPGRSQTGICPEPSVQDVYKINNVKWSPNRRLIWGLKTALRRMSWLFTLPVTLQAVMQRVSSVCGS